ncbi:MAG: GtrA family protein [Pseudomonadales bacterium]
MQNLPPSTKSAFSASTLATWLQKHEFLRFLVTGSINTGSSWLVYLLVRHTLLFVGLHAITAFDRIAISADKLAFTVAYIFGIVFTYYLNSRWVFRVPMSWRAFLEFPSVYVVQYGVGIVLMHILVDRLAFPVDFAPLAVVVVTMPVTFVLSRLVLKRHDRT